MYKCPKCNAEFELGTKFCQNCGCNLEKDFIENPICPKCNKSFPAGTKFCDNDGSKLVSPEKLIPRCVKCGKEYTDGTKFCSQDGGKVIAEAYRGANDFNDSISDVSDDFGSKLTATVKEWNIGVIIWAVFVLIANLIVLIRSFDYIQYIIKGVEYIENWSKYDYCRILIFICPAVIIFGIIKLLQKEKSGFTMIAIAALISFVCNIVIGLTSSAIFALISVGIWYAVLQIRKDGISAWQMLD